MRKPSFFEKLTGSIPPEDYDDLFESEYDTPQPSQPQATDTSGATNIHLDQSALQQDSEQAVPTTGEVHKQAAGEHWGDEYAQEGQLSVDIYQKPDQIVVKALVAGVNPNSIDISLTRDMITIRGHREEHKEVTEENYFYQELYWGGFTRTILLPEEVDVDSAEASTTHGILTIRLPKINKERQTKLKVRSR